MSWLNRIWDQRRVPTDHIYQGAVGAVSISDLQVIISTSSPLKSGSLNVEVEEVQRDFGAKGLGNYVDALTIGRVGVWVERGGNYTRGGRVLTATNWGDQKYPAWHKKQNKTVHIFLTRLISNPKSVMPNGMVRLEPYEDGVGLRGIAGGDLPAAIATDQWRILVLSFAQLNKVKTWEGRRRRVSPTLRSILKTMPHSYMHDRWDSTSNDKKLTKIRSPLGTRITQLQSKLLE